MSNSQQAFPQIQIQCRDTVRNFCLNLGGFRALEEHMTVKTGDETYSLINDFDFTSEKIENLILLMWAGLYTDARKRKKENPSEPEWTIEEAEDVVDFINVGQVQNCIQTSLSRMMSVDQYEKLKQESEKKSKERRVKQVAARKKRRN